MLEGITEWLTLVFIIYCIRFIFLKDESSPDRHRASEQIPENESWSDLQSNLFHSEQAFHDESSPDRSRAREQTPKNESWSDLQSKRFHSEQTFHGHHNPPITVARYENEFITSGIDEVKGLLTDQEVANLPVMVIAVIGKCRTGKSFLLNNMIRYLDAMEREHCGKHSVDEDSSLHGFSWKYGARPDTNGILMWNHVFKIPGPKKTKVAVILMDTQGLFDRKMDIHAEASIFTLSFVSCSLLIYNIPEHITVDHLRLLKDAICAQKLKDKSGKTTKETKVDIKKEERREAKRNRKFFQKLLFLVRDWKDPKEFDHGSEGGQKYLTTVLLPGEDNTNEKVLEDINTFFQKKECFLLPYPGPTVAGHTEDDLDGKKTLYDGRQSGMSGRFRYYIQRLCNSLFEESKIEIKGHPNNMITCEGLYHILKVATEKMNDKVLIDSFEAMDHLECTTMVTDAMLSYRQQMDEYVWAEGPYREKEKLKEIHEEAKKKASEHLVTYINTWQGADKYLKDLENKYISVMWENIQMRNQKKTKDEDKKAFDTAEKELHLLFDEAFSMMFSTKTAEEMSELRKESLKRAEEKLSKYFKGDEADLRSRKQKLESICTKLYEDKKKQNKTRVMAKHGAMVALAIVPAILSGGVVTGIQAGAEVMMAVGAAGGTISFVSLAKAWKSWQRFFGEKNTETPNAETANVETTNAKKTPNAENNS